MNKEDYDNIPVYFCQKCLSLKIRTLDEYEQEQGYCEDCGSMSIECGNIHTWETKYKEKYGNTYLNKGNN